MNMDICPGGSVGIQTHWYDFCACICFKFVCVSVTGADSCVGYEGSGRVLPPRVDRGRRVERIGLFLSVVFERGATAENPATRK